VNPVNALGRRVRRIRLLKALWAKLEMLNTVSSSLLSSWPFKV
jgi:hypothetical protein